MKALILTCSTGEGHNSVAEAVREEISARGLVCDVTDALSFLSKYASKFICGWHVRMYRYMPKICNTGYKLAESHPSAFEEASLAYKILSAGVKRLRKYVVAGGYDCIICPHVIPSLMVTIMCRRWPELELQTCNIATDYTCSPMTGESRLDWYFVPDKSLVKDFELSGIPAEKIVPVSGIPVRRKFRTPMEKPFAKKALGLPADCRHILMMFGSMGCGPMTKLTELLMRGLPDNAYVTVVCGTNTALLKKLESACAGHNNIRLLGYTKDIPLLMDSADLFLTKPGGISTAEAAVKGLPMVLVDAVACCEEYNLNFFCAHGGAVTARTTKALAKECIRLIGDDAALKKMSSALRRTGSSADEVAARLTEGYKEDEKAVEAALV